MSPLAESKPLPDRSLLVTFRCGHGARVGLDRPPQQLRAKASGELCPACTRRQSDEPDQY